MPPQSSGGAILHPSTLEALRSISSLFLSLALVTILLILLLLFSIALRRPHRNLRRGAPQILSNKLNYGLLERYWSSSHPDSRVSTYPDHRYGLTHLRKPANYPSHPETPLIKQHSAESWILRDLETQRELRGGSFAERVLSWEEADVVFVPSFDGGKLPDAMAARLASGWRSSRSPSVNEIELALARSGQGLPRQ